MYIFADDTTIFIRGYTLHFMIPKIKRDLNALSTFFKQNRLTLNLDKTNLIVFSLTDQVAVILDICRATTVLGRPERH